MSQDDSPGIAKELTSPRENAQSASVPRTAVECWDIFIRPCGTEILRVTLPSTDVE